MATITSRSRKLKARSSIEKTNDDHAPPVLLLPPELIATIFSFLRARDVGHGAFACKAFLSAASLHATAWTLAIAEFDPFCNLGKGDEMASGAWKLFRAAGSWLRVFLALAGRHPSCAKFHAAEMSCTIFCQCSVRRTRAATASSSPSGGFVKKCGLHYHCKGLEKGTCVKIEAPMLNRFMFLGQGVWRTVVAIKRDPGASRIALQEAIDEAPAFSTLAIKGKFTLDEIDEPLFLDKPVRIVGGPGARLISVEYPVVVSSPLIVMENVSINMKSMYNPRGYYCESCGGYHGVEGPPVRSPALQVSEDCGFIGIGCKINCEMGHAILMSEESKASCNALLMDCALSSHGFPGENCGGGVCVKDNCLLSMYGCKIERAELGVVWGKDEDGRKLSSLQLHNTIDVKDDITNEEEEYTAGQIIQPWVNSNWHTRPPTHPRPIPQLGSAPV